MNLLLTNPYKGPFSFKSNDEDIFFGREKETQELINLIKKNQLTILFGASGTGKTSLVHAKLLPQLQREYFHPIYIRINFSNRNESPLMFVQSKIVEALRIWDNSIKPFHSNQTLIDFAARNIIFKGLIKPVLFFDQFEELFTLGPDSDAFEISQLIHQLSDLIELRLPDDLKDNTYVKNISNFKVLISLRQEWIGYLDDYSHVIPSILENRFRLKKFSYEQATEAIINPAKDYVSVETANKIIQFIGEKALLKNVNLIDDLSNNPLLNREVDPFILSLYCFQLFEKAIERGASEIDMLFVDENDPSKLIRAYYDEKLNKYEESDLLKKMIENKLLNESGKRLIIYLSDFSNDAELTSKVQIVSEETGILHIKPLADKSEIEIVHDRLAVEIFASRQEREIREKNLEATHREEETRGLRQQALEKRNEAEKFRNRASEARRNTIIISILALIVAGSILWWGINRSSTIIQEAKDNYTVEGLNKQLLAQNLIIERIRDSLNLLKVHPVDNSINKRYIVESLQVKKMQNVIDSLIKLNAPVSFIINKSYEESDILPPNPPDKEKHFAALIRENDSLRTLLHMEIDHDLPSDLHIPLRSENIYVSEFCPYGYKTVGKDFNLEDIAQTDLSFKFEVQDYKLKNDNETLHISITYPTFTKTKVQTYNDSCLISSCVDRKRVILISNKRKNVFARGTYAYTIFIDKNKILKSGKFVVK